ncbi:MAG TPA: hypothetical protein VIM07_00415 [Chitinophagaceae bacterium]
MEKLKEVAGAVLDHPIPFEVDIIHPDIWQRLKKEKKKSFQIRPSTLGTMIKISQEFLSIGLENFNKEDPLNSNFALISDHAERMARIVAFAVQNSKQDPPKSLISFFLENLTSKELYALVNIILTQIDTVNFLKSIISARGINLLGMNPKTQGSSVAPGTL